MPEAHQAHALSNSADPALLRWATEARLLANEPFEDIARKCGGPSGSRSERGGSCCSAPGSCPCSDIPEPDGAAPLPGRPRTAGAAQRLRRHTMPWETRG